MIRLFSLVLAVTAISCANSPASLGRGNRDTIIRYDTLYRPDNWQEGFGLSHNPEEDSINGKPASFYLNNPACDPTAKDFYYGQFRPTDNFTTDHLLQLTRTQNDSLRPFYRWILNQTILIQDGALAESTGVPARKYAEQYPAEFFEYMDADTSGHRYHDWVDAIAYSGYLDHEDAGKQATISKNLQDSMIKNCHGCAPSVQKRIVQFAGDCFRQ